MIDLGPYAFDEISLGAALERCPPVWQRRYGIRVCSIPRDDLPSDRGHLFGITQEAVMNAVKHGSANHVSISLRFEDDRIELSIVDDGKARRRDPSGSPSPGTSAWRACANAPLLGGTLGSRAPRGQQRDVAVPRRPASAARLDPAAVGGDENRLGAIARAQLRVGVVQMGAHRACGSSSSRRSACDLASASA